MTKIQNKGFNGTFENIRRNKSRKKLRTIDRVQLFLTFEFRKFEFVSNFVLRISNLSFFV